MPSAVLRTRQDDYNQTLEADRFAAVQLKPLNRIQISFTPQGKKMLPPFILRSHLPKFRAT
jgi:hypothetical protein